MLERVPSFVGRYSFSSLLKNSSFSARSFSLSPNFWLNVASIMAVPVSTGSKTPETST